ncbi:MAG: LptA/OstA family protein [Myxococcota bacterium]
MRGTAKTAIKPTESLGDGPLDFRCNSMQIKTKPNRTVCRDDVVVRRGNLLVCCNVFEGYATNDWGWERFVCIDEVRAQRGDETMWADKAAFDVETSALVLTGRPRLHRGKSILEGKRIVIDVENDRARIEQPRGRLESIKSNVLHGVSHSQELPLEGKLPDTCPLPPAPAR